MAGTFHVYVDGASAPGRDAILQLAEAMASRFGLPAGELATRIGAGRFRVKANTDRGSADSLARELQEIGARCSVEDASSARATPPAGLPTGQPQFHSGLSAAFSGQVDTTNLGALASDGKPLSLASLDGESSRPVRVPSFAPPGSPPPLPPPVARGAQPSRPAAPPPPRPPTSPAVAPLDDAFAPPDAAEQELTFELAPDEIARQVRKRLSTPPQNEPLSAPLAPMVSRTMSRRDAAPEVGAATVTRGARVGGSRLGPLADRDMRFAAGVFLAILLGFVPAHMVASMRERSAFAAVDSNVVAIQNRADSAEDYAALDAMRATQLDKKRSERRNIAIGALVMWGLVGAGIGFGWHRLPWDDWEDARG